MFLPRCALRLRLLGVAHEVLDEVYVLLQNISRDTLAFEVRQEGLPRRIYIRRREASLGVVTHVRDMLE